MELQQLTAKSKCETEQPAKFFPGCGLVASAIRQTPFGVSFINPNDQLICAVRNFHSSIVAPNAARFLRLLHSFASQNPLLRKLSSFSSEFHSSRQIRCRDSWRLNTLSRHNFAAVLPGDSVAGVVVASGILNFLNIYNILITARLVLTWFPNTPPVIVSPLSTLCDPYLSIFRGIIPPLGGTLDLSPILAILALNVFSNAAAALPAELPSSGVCEEGPSQITIRDQNSTS
ncbi:hypothetical protein Dimus_010592 [Dionaea muscipula]